MASHYRATAHCLCTPACVYASACMHVCRPRVQILDVFVCEVFFRWREKEQAQCVGQGVSLMRLYSCGMRVTHTDNGQGNI